MSVGKEFFSENIAKPEQIRRWISIGGDPGLKSRDLFDFGLLHPSSGLEIPAFATIGVSFARDHFKSLASDPTPELITQTSLTQEQLSDLEFIVRSMTTGNPVAIRSSATDEHGGTGIYKTNFMVPSGEPVVDIQALEDGVKEVWASYYSKVAEEFREGKPDLAPEFEKLQGIAVMVQEVVGDRVDNDHFMPALAGVLTFESGQPASYVVIGMGTRAVGPAQSVNLFGDEINLENINEGLESLSRADAISLATGEVEEIPLSEQMRESARDSLPKLQTVLDYWGKLQSDGKPYYLEFAIAKGKEKPCIVQACPKELPKPEEIEKAVEPLPAPVGRVILEGTDTVGTGKKQGRGIIGIGLRGGFDSKDIALMDDLNETNKGYLLVIPDKGFSGLTTQATEQLTYDRFSNSEAVVELEVGSESVALGFTTHIDHREGRGGAHFRAVCQDKRIFFLAAPVESINDFTRQNLGEPVQRLGNFSGFWDVDWTMNNRRDAGRLEITKDHPLPEFSLEELKELADKFYKTGRVFEDFDKSLSDAFFDMCNFVSDNLGQAYAGFDPFRQIQSLTEEQAQEMIQNSATVMDNLFYLPDYDDWQYYQGYAAREGETPEVYPPEAYLRKLQQKLEEKLKG